MEDLLGLLVQAKELAAAEQEILKRRIDTANKRIAKVEEFFGSILKVTKVISLYTCTYQEKDSPEASYEGLIWKKDHNGKWSLHFRSYETMIVVDSIEGPDLYDKTTKEVLFKSAPKEKRIKYSSKFLEQFVKKYIEVTKEYIKEQEVLESEEIIRNIL